MTDAITLLTADRRQVGSLYAQIGDRTSLRQPVIDEIVRLLSIHDAVEEQLLNPTLRERVGGGNATADRSLAEHQKVAELLYQVDQGDQPQAVLAALRETIDNVGEHVAEEDSPIFPARRAGRLPAPPPGTDRYARLEGRQARGQI
jgi:hemerythrin superfamily protein